MSESNNGLYNKIDKSAALTVIGIILMFSGAVVVTLFAPLFVEKQWTTPTSDYQVQMYTEADPNVYLSAVGSKSPTLQAVYHLKQDETPLAFIERDPVYIVAPDSLQQFITAEGEETLKLTRRLLMLRSPKDESINGWNAQTAADRRQRELQDAWRRANPGSEQLPRYTILELYVPGGTEAFSLTETDGITEDWVDDRYVLLDAEGRDITAPDAGGTLYVGNPNEFRIVTFASGPRKGFEYNPDGRPIASLGELQSDEFGFVSRQKLIAEGELLYAQEGCHYCHTDQSRTLVQDSVLNGSDSYPAPPSSPNEYVFQLKTFMGTRRIGPDLSRVGIKRPHRDWHKSHFWAPKTESAGSIMPAFRHFFDDDPRGTSRNPYGVSNYRFEAMFQYLMTKGTRITPPTQAWWTGDDPIRTIDIIEGRGARA